jgi:hypothetical protein
MNFDLSNYSGKLYLPESIINNNYSYYLNGNNIRIITNNNCYTQYNSTYCDCYDYIYSKDILTESISCNTSSNLSKIDKTLITSDKYYSDSIMTQFFNTNYLYLLMFIGVILFITFLTKERTGY